MDARWKQSRLPRPKLSGFTRRSGSDRVRKRWKVLKLKRGPQPEVRARISRVTRLLALAHRFEKLIREGEARDYADLARLGHVNRDRLTQIMNLLNLAPDVHEAILFLPPVTAGHDPVHERQLTPIVRGLDWGKQRKNWSAVGSVAPDR